MAAAISARELLEQRRIWPFGGSMPVGHCWEEQRGQERRAPPRGKAGKDTGGCDFGGGRGWHRVLGRAGCEPGRQGWSRPPRPARASRAVWRPPQPFPSSRPLYFYPPFPLIIIITINNNNYYYCIFPAQSGKRGLLERAPRRGRHFPGKAQRAAAPGAPEREPEGSARPRALLRAGRGSRGSGSSRRPATAQRPPASPPPPASPV